MIKYPEKGVITMSHIKTIFEGNVRKDVDNEGCGECQASCQSACKTSCTVANQSCEQVKA